MTEVTQQQQQFGITVIYPCESQLKPVPTGVSEVFPQPSGLESTCSRHFLRPLGGLRLPTGRDPVLEVAMELLPGKHHRRGSVRLGPHLRVKPRQPAKTCSQPLSFTLPQVAQMDV